MPGMSRWGVNRCILGDDWLASLACLATFQANKRPCHKQKTPGRHLGGDTWDCLLISMCTHLHTQVHAYKPKFQWLGTVMQNSRKSYLWKKFVENLRVWCKIKLLFNTCQNSYSRELSRELWAWRLGSHDLWPHIQMFQGALLLWATEWFKWLQCI